MIVWSTTGDTGAEHVMRKSKDSNLRQLMRQTHYSKNKISIFVSAYASRYLAELNVRELHWCGNSRIIFSTKEEMQTRTGKATRTNPFPDWFELSISRNSEQSPFQFLPAIYPNTRIWVTLNTWTKVWGRCDRVNKNETEPNRPQSMPPWTNLRSSPLLTTTGLSSKRRTELRSIWDK